MGDFSARRKKRLRLWAGISVAAMLAWFVVTNHVDLFPLNDLSRQGDQLSSTLSGFIPFGLALLSVSVFPNVWLILFWTGYAYVWLALQSFTWWVPYLLGPPAEHRSEYANTIRILPAVDGRFGPDLQHLVLEVLSLAMAVALTVLTIHLLRNRRGGTGRREGEA